MSNATPKSQRVQKWILLSCLVVAVFVWSRNLLLLLPDDSALFITEDATATQTNVSRRQETYLFSFHDSMGWRDPFVPPSPRHTVGSTDSSRAKRRVPLRPPPDPPPWKLAGIVWDKISPAAILASLDGQQRVVVAKGDLLGTSRVERIDEHNVWIHHQGRPWKLALAEPGGELHR